MIYYKKLFLIYFGQLIERNKCVAKSDVQNENEIKKEKEVPADKVPKTLLMRFEQKPQEYFMRYEAI